MLAFRCWASSLVHLPQEIVSLQSTHTGQHGAHTRIAHTQTQTRTHADAPHSKTGNLVKAAGYQNNTNIVDQAWMLQCPQLWAMPECWVCVSLCSLCVLSLEFELPSTRKRHDHFNKWCHNIFLNECWDRNIQIKFFGRLLKTILL